MAEDRDLLFLRFEYRMEEVIEATKVRINGAAKCMFGFDLENFPQMEFTKKFKFYVNDERVSARGIVIGDNFTNKETMGVFTSPYDKTSAKIIPEMFRLPVTMVFDGEQITLHRNNAQYPNLEPIAETPPDFYLAFARAVMNAIEKDSARIRRFGR